MGKKKKEESHDSAKASENSTRFNKEQLSFGFFNNKGYKVVVAAVVIVVVVVAVIVVVVNVVVVVIIVVVVIVSPGPDICIYVFHQRWKQSRNHLAPIQGKGLKLPMELKRCQRRAM